MQPYQSNSGIPTLTIGHEMTEFQEQASAIEELQSQAAKQAIRVKTLEDKVKKQEAILHRLTELQDLTAETLTSLNERLMKTIAALYKLD